MEVRSGESVTNGSNRGKWGGSTGVRGEQPRVPRYGRYLFDVGSHDAVSCTKSMILDTVLRGKIHNAL